MIRCAALTPLTVALCFWTVCARAENPVGGQAKAAADSLTKSAVAAFDEGDYAAALGLLQRASVLAPSPVIGLYRARSHVALGQLVDAADDYRGVVDSTEADTGTPNQLRVVERARDELAQLRPRIPLVEFALGDSELRSRNLRLVIDGSLVRPGSRSPVNPGHHEIVASDADGEKARLPFDIGEGESKTLALGWRSDARASKEPFNASSAWSTRRALGVVALGVGATGLGIGTVTGIAALTRYHAGEQHCPAGRCSEGPNVPENSSAFLALRTISAAGYVVGAGGIGTWLGLLLTTPTPSASTERPRVSAWTPVVGMGSAGARYAF